MDKKHRRKIRVLNKKKSSNSIVTHLKVASRNLKMIKAQKDIKKGMKSLHQRSEINGNKFLIIKGSTAGSSLKIREASASPMAERDSFRTSTIDTNDTKRKTILKSKTTTKKTLQKIIKDKLLTRARKSRQRRSDEVVSFNKKLSKFKLKPEPFDKSHNSETSCNLKQSTDSEKIQNFPKNIGNKKRVNFRKSEIIQFKPGSTLSFGLKSNPSEKMRNLMPYNLKSGDSRFRIVSSKELSKKNQTESNQASTATEHKARDQQVKGNSGIKGIKQIKKYTQFGGKSLQKKEVSWAQNLPTSCSSSQSLDRSPKKSSSGLLKDISKGVKFSGIETKETFGNCNKNELIDSITLINPDPHSIFHECSPCNYSNRMKDCFKPCALERRLNSVAKQDCSPSASQSYQKPIMKVPPKTPLKKERLPSVSNKPLIQGDLEGYNLISEYSFSKDISGIILPPTSKRYSLENPRCLDQTETDIFELSEANSKI
ncbi:unnamed protein product [Moneuplotes crassus]|uniref:Uncharacterized protein n=1 Tax=Euplotes crassus TaxID=5936 RepID=A0AAD1Y671_EUPCR|nr:unnamed protein product [Moneuplotes crassus]